MAATIQTILKPTRARGLDTSGNNNHAQIYSGRALEFDGVTDYLHIGAETTFSTGACTISCWVNIANYASSIADHLVDSDATSSFSNVGFDTSGHLAVYDYGGGTWRDSTSILQKNTWYRVVYSYDGSGTLTFYINGVADGTGVIDTSGDNDDCIVEYIGMRHNNTRYFDGMMSDLQIWDAAWTAADAEYDYLNPEQLALNRGGTSLTNSNLKLWYPMNDGHRGNQSYVLDASNTGIVTGDIITNGSMEGTWHTSDTLAESWNVTGSGGGLVVSQQTGVTGYAQGVLGGSTSHLVQQTLTHVSGVTYKLTVTGKRVSGSGTGYVRLLSDVIGTSTNVISFTSSEFETKSYIYTSQETGDSNLRLYVSDTSTVVAFDDISIMPINDKHNATTVFYGDEQITDQVNRDFSGSGNWGNYGSSSTAPSISGGKLVCVTDGDGGNEGAQLALSAVDGTGGAYPIVAGRTYRMSAKLDNTAGKTTPDINFSLGGKHVNVIRTSDNDTTGTIDTTEQAYHADITADDNSTAVLIYQTSADNDATTTFTIDDVSIKEVGTSMGWTDADQQLDIPQTALQSYNQLAWFDGTQGVDNYIAFSDGSSDLNFQATDRTISFWFYPLEEDDENGYVMNKGTFGTGGDGSGWYIYYNSSTGALQYYTNQTGNNQPNNSIALTYGEWAHCAVVISDSGTDSTWYINGEAGTPKTNHFAPSSDTQNFNLMNRAGATKACGGSINEVSIWNKTLTQSEINELYNNGLALDATGHSASANLLHYWRNNGLSTWTDIGNAGSLYNGTPTNITETMLITAGVDSSRDSQGFLINRQRTTNSLNNNTIIDGDVDRGAYSKVETHPLYTGSAVTNYSISFWMKLGIKPSDFLSSGNSFVVFDTTKSNANRAFKLYLPSNTNIMYLYTFYGSSASNESVYVDYDLDSLGNSIVNPPTAATNGIGEAFDPNKWYHVTCTFDHDRTTGSGNADNTNAEDHNFTPYFLYINGIQVAAEGREGANSAMTTARSMQNANVPMIIGSDMGSDGTITETSYQDFPGELDDICFYSDTLTDEEVTRNYNAGKRSHR